MTLRINNPLIIWSFFFASDSNMKDNKPVSEITIKEFMTKIIKEDQPIALDKVLNSIKTNRMLT